MGVDWGGYLERVAASLKTGRRQAITHTIETVQAESGSQAASIREAGYWNAAIEERKNFDYAARHGMTVEAHTDEAGKVVAVTYRLKQP